MDDTCIKNEQCKLEVQIYLKIQVMTNMFALQLTVDLWSDDFKIKMGYVTVIHNFHTCTKFEDCRAKINLYSCQF